MIRLALLSATLPLCLAQAPQERVQADGHIMPSWLRLGGEVRGRAEVNLAPSLDLDERLYLNRLRLDATVRPLRWARFVFQGQDARSFCFVRDAERRDTFDIRLGYVEVGHPEEGWRVRAGRQELAVGDERLLGADSYWDPFGQSFDAVRVSYGAERFQADAFTGYRVQPGRRRPDRLDWRSRMAGLFFKWKAGEGSIAPYVLWRRGGGSADLMDRPGHRDAVTPGVLVQGELPRNLDYNIEVAVQRGHVAGDGIIAWAGHWAAGWKPLGRDMGPRLEVEFNFASGDSNPADGRHAAFDDLYPAGFNKYGTSDLIAWRNIRYPAAGVDIPLSRHWTMLAGFRAYWLATIRDGLYPGGDAYLVRNPQAGGSHVGNQALVSAAYSGPAHLRVQGGYGHLFAGEYLRRCGHGAAMKSVYVLSSFTF